MWKYKHRQAHQRYRDGKPPLKLPKAVTERFEYEFERALVERGNAAKEAALKVQQ